MPAETYRSLEPASAARFGSWIGLSALLVGPAHLVIPALLTAVTGVVFEPAMYLLTARGFARERLALGES
jgi:hypothetical protein